MTPSIRGWRWFVAFWVIGALVVSSPALALDCYDIVELIDAEVPTDQILTIVSIEGDNLTEADVACLEGFGVSGVLLAGVERRVRGESAVSTGLNPLEDALSQVQTSPLEAVEVLVIERGVMPSWVKMGPWVANLRGSVGVTGVYVQEAPWYEQPGYQQAQQRSLAGLDRLVLLYVTPLDEELDIAVTTWSLQRGAVVEVSLERPLTYVEPSALPTPSVPSKRGVRAANPSNVPAPVRYTGRMPGSPTVDAPASKRARAARPIGSRLDIGVGADLSLDSGVRAVFRGTWAFKNHLLARVSNAPTHLPWDPDYGPPRTALMGWVGYHSDAFDVAVGGGLATAFGNRSWFAHLGPMAGVHYRWDPPTRWQKRKYLGWALRGDAVVGGLWTLQGSAPLVSWEYDGDLGWRWKRMETFINLRMGNAYFYSGSTSFNLGIHQLYRLPSPERHASWWLGYMVGLGPGGFNSRLQVSMRWGSLRGS